MPRVTAERRARFLEVLSETANVSSAAKASKISRKTWYEHRAANAGFKAQWDEAMELGTDGLEDEATRRGREGTLKPVYQQGRKVGEVREYSDTLLIFMLKARRPEKFKDRSAQELTGKDGGPVQVSTATDDLISRISRIAARSGANAGAVKA